MSRHRIDRETLASRRRAHRLSLIADSCYSDFKQLATMVPRGLHWISPADVTKTARSKRDVQAMLHVAPCCWYLRPEYRCGSLRWRWHPSCRQSRCLYQRRDPAPLRHCCWASVRRHLSYLLPYENAGPLIAFTARLPRCRDSTTAQQLNKEKQPQNHVKMGISTIACAAQADRSADNRRLLQCHDWRHSAGSVCQRRAARRAKSAGNLLSCMHGSPIQLLLQAVQSGV